MPLSRQLIIIILLLFIMVFMGTLGVSISNTRDYLSRQLESHAQDTASSLGLSLTPHLEKNDLPIMTSMVDAIFDRGYYREIKIIAINGTPIIERVLNVSIEGVPSWFVELIPLQTPEGLSTISIQWNQAAKVHVYSHPGYAYLDLWRNTIETFWWFLLSFVIGTGVFIFLLRIILTPLSQVEEQALAITRREFPVMKDLPWTRELRRVVMAMNKMSVKVKSMISEQIETIERVRKEAYIDELTGLANRRSFDMQLGHIVKTVDEITQGAVFLVRLNDLAEINNTQGYLAGDDFVKDAANAIRHCTLNIPHAFVARIAGEEFGILLPGIEFDTAKELAKEMAYQIPLIKKETPTEGICHIGSAWYSGKTDGKTLLAKADMALRSVIHQPNAWQVQRVDEVMPEPVHGAQDWGQILQNSIDKHLFSFYRQPVQALADNQRLHYEIFTRLVGPEGNEISAMTFMPMAERLSLMPKLDRYILTTLIEQLKDSAKTGTDSFAINLSPSSLRDPSFMDWLYASLAEIPEIAGKIILETTEHAAISDVTAFKSLVNRLHALGCRFSLDHFGNTFAPFGYLHDLKLDIIKIHGGLVRGVAENKDNRFFIQSLNQIAHGLDIQVIGEFVETEADEKELKEIGLDGGQGYYVGELESWI